MEYALLGSIQPHITIYASKEANKRLYKSAITFVNKKQMTGLNKEKPNQKQMTDLKELSTKNLLNYELQSTQSHTKLLSTEK